LAKKFVNDRYSARQWGRQIWSLYEQILKGRTLPAASVPSALR